MEETAMNVPSSKLSRAHHHVCPFCESGELVFFGPGLARCCSCGLPLLGAMLETLRSIAGLPEALGAHPCECGHPEMRGLPDGVFHCPACGSEVLPVQIRVPDARGKGRPWSAT
jgi:ribosomal protein L37AE/L43A